MATGRGSDLVVRRVLGCGRNRWARHGMSRHVMSCHVMSCHVMSCVIVVLCMATVSRSTTGGRAKAWG